jgi:hypothetical protein
MDLIITLTVYSGLLLLDAAPAMSYNWKRILHVVGLINFLRVMFQMIFVDGYADKYVVTIQRTTLDLRNVALAALFDFCIFFSKYTYHSIFYPEMMTILSVQLRLSEGRPAAAEDGTTGDGKSTFAIPLYGCFDLLKNALRSCRRVWQR